MQKEVTTRTWSFSQLVHELEFRQASIIHFVCFRCNITDGVHCSLSLTLIVVYICMLVCMHSLILLLRKCHSFMLHVPLVLHVCFLEKEKMRAVLTIFMLMPELLFCSQHKIFRNFFRCHRSIMIITLPFKQQSEPKCSWCSQTIWRQIMHSIRIRFVREKCMRTNAKLERPRGSEWEYHACESLSFTYFQRFSYFRAHFIPSELNRMRSNVCMPSSSCVCRILNRRTFSTVRKNRVMTVSFFYSTIFCCLHCVKFIFKLLSFLFNSYFVQRFSLLVLILLLLLLALMCL